MQPYATATGTVSTLRALKGAGWGMLLTPDSYARSRLQYAIDNRMPIAIDNGAFAAFLQKKDWAESYRWEFVQLVRRASRHAPDLLRWIVAPDIVAGGLESLELSRSWIKTVQDWSRTASIGKARPIIMLPVQDGMTPEDVIPILDEYPGQLGIFLGGSTLWKWRTVCKWGKLARERGILYHVARVNTMRSIWHAESCGATSYDGTGVIQYPSTLERLERARAQMSLELMNPADELEWSRGSAKWKAAFAPIKAMEVAGLAVHAAIAELGSAKGNKMAAQPMAVKALEELIATLPEGDSRAPGAERELERIARVKLSRYRFDKPALLQALRSAKGWLTKTANQDQESLNRKEASERLVEWLFETDTPSLEFYDSTGDWLELVRTMADGLIGADEEYPPGVEPNRRARWLLADPFVPWEQFTWTGGVRVSRKIFGRAIAAELETSSAPEPAAPGVPEHSWTQLRTAHAEGMRTTRAGRDKVAQRLGFNWWENLELALEEMAESDGHYLLTGRERNQWTTREKVASILARKLGPGEELSYPRQQLEAVLMMSPSDFTAYQKAMRGRYQ